jgi:hypothetical protein
MMTHDYRPGMVSTTGTGYPLAVFLPVRYFDDARCLHFAVRNAQCSYVPDVAVLIDCVIYVLRCGICNANCARQSTVRRFAWGLSSEYIQPDPASAIVHGTWDLGGCCFVPAVVLGGMLRLRWTCDWSY